MGFAMSGRARAVTRQRARLRVSYHVSELTGKVAIPPPVLAGLFLKLTGWAF